jgi:uncharacterized protein
VSISAEDLAEVSRQLGRPARDILEIASRCVCGRPLVVKTNPRLADGTPFPTLYYLTQPAVTAAVSTLEASGLMAQLQQRLGEEEDLKANYQLAHESYLQEREAILEVAEIKNFSAGGMPDRVKCLHALVGHSLAKGPGVNLIGDIALENLPWSPAKCECQ